MDPLINTIGLIWLILAIGSFIAFVISLFL